MEGSTTYGGAYMKSEEFSNQPEQSRICRKMIMHKWDWDIHVAETSTTTCVPPTGHLFLLKRNKFDRGWFLPPTLNNKPL